MHFRNFDHVNDLMVNLGYQMVEDYHCYSFSDCWTTHIEMAVFQKQRKSKAEANEISKWPESSRIKMSNIPGSLCGA